MMETEASFPDGLKVLLVDDDATCLKVVGRMLQHCRYTVTACRQPNDALSLLRERRGAFDLVITDVRMPDMDGFKLLEHIELELDLPVIMMSADNEKDTVLRSLIQGACFYLSKPVKVVDLMNIWQHVVKKRQGRKKDTEQAGSVEDNEQRRTPQREEVEQRKRAIYTGCASSVNEGNYSKKRKNTKADDDDDDDDAKEEDDESSTRKKSRVLWSTELHQQFLEAVNRIGIDRAVPKKILEYMKVSGITRENVASHLQKYRLFLKRVEEANQYVALGAKPPCRIPSKSIFGTIPNKVMLHSKQQQSFSQFNGVSQASTLGLPSSQSSQNPYSCNLFGSFPRLTYEQQLLNNQGNASQLNPSSNFQLQATYLQGSLGASHPNTLMLQNNQMKEGHSQYGARNTEPMQPALLNNFSGYGMQGNRQVNLLSILDHTQDRASFGNANASSNNYNIQLQSTQMGILGLNQCELDGAGSVLTMKDQNDGMGRTDVGKDKGELPISEFNCTNLLYDSSGLDEFNSLQCDTVPKTFIDLLQPQTDLPCNDHIKFGEESFSDVFRGFLQDTNPIPRQFSGNYLEEIFFKQQPGENDGNFRESELGMDAFQKD